MPVSENLFLSILAMDSYNRGYDALWADAAKVAGRRPIWPCPARGALS